MLFGSPNRKHFRLGEPSEHELARNRQAVYEFRDRLREREPTLFNHIVRPVWLTSLSGHSKCEVFSKVLRVTFRKLFQQLTG